MAKLIMWNLMTLDGFFEGPNRDISWHFDDWGEELERLSIEQLKSAGGLMFGRVTYQLMANHWPNATGEVADFMNALPKYVFSRTLTRSDWANTQMFGADMPDSVARLKRENARDIWRNAAVQAGRTRKTEAARKPGAVIRHCHPALCADIGRLHVTHAALPSAGVVLLEGADRVVRK